MAVIASATGVALGMTAGTIGAGLVGGAVLGAGIGGLYSAFTGDGDILNSMLTGGLIGFGVGGLGAAAGAASAGSGGAALGGTGAAGAGGAAASSLSLTPTATALAGNTAALIPASTAGTFGTLSAGAAPTVAGLGATGAGGAAAAGTGLTTGQILGYGLAGSAAMSLLGNSKTPKLSPTTGTDPSYIRPYTYAANPTNNYQVAPGGFPAPYNGLGSTAENRYFNQTQTAQPVYQAAEGGLTPNLDFMGNGAYPMSQQNTSYYAVPRQMPTSAQQVAASYEQNTNPLTGQPIAMAKGGKAKEDNEFSFDDLTKKEKKYLLDLMASPIKGEMAPGSNVGYENSFEKYLMSQAPQGFTGRIGTSRVNDDGSKLRAGASGIAMAQPGKQGVTTMPGNYDIGYTSPRKSAEDAYIDLNAFRSINSVPGRGHEQGINARYTMPFVEGGNVNAMNSDQAVKAYNDAIMQKAIQTYVTPQQAPLGQNTAQPMAPQGYAAQQVPSNFDQILLDQYRSANPNLRSYNAATQMYGAGIPNQGQYDAFKAQKEKEAADLLAQQYAYNPGNNYGGGGAAGGLPRDFAYANGGHLGGYSDGGRMLKGPGDGMSDNIPASINGKQPARLADGEFVVPADVVSHLGNGSTDAGAKRLYSMMDDVRKARTGHKKQGKQIKANKYLPA